MRKYWKLFPVVLLVCACLTDIAKSFNNKGNEEEDTIVTFYNQRCAGCHGTDGQPSRDDVPDFTDPNFHTEHTDEALSVAILDGKPPRMPGYRAKLDDNQAKAMVALIRNFGKKAPGK
jgi:mono/diheme cytochrome c family protein